MKMDAAADLLAHYEFGPTPLHITVRFGDVGLSQLLIQKGADVNASDAFENTPLSLACIETPNKAMVKLLLKSGADMNIYRKVHMDLFLECVLNCSSQEHVEIVSIFIERGININMTDKISNRSCMHYVAMTGYVPLAKLLLACGAILNIRDNFNCTPLTISKTHKNLEVYKLFKLYLD